MKNFVLNRIFVLLVQIHFSVATSVVGSPDTWSWVAINPGDSHMSNWVSPLNNQEIDINKLHVFSNISDLLSDVKVSMRFRNPHQLQLYQHFIVRMGDVSRIKGFTIDHMGVKVAAQKMHQRRAERLVNMLRNGGPTATGIIMTRTSPYLREFDVHVFLESQTSMTFDLTYKERLKTLLSVNWYEQQIRVYPYQLVEDFEMNVVIKRPSTGTVSQVDAYWDRFSASSIVKDPWGLEREPLTIRPWNGGNRINVSPIRSEMTSPRSWESDLIVFFEWDAPDFGFEELTWSSYSDTAVHYESSDSYSSSFEVTQPEVTLDPHITDPTIVAPTEKLITNQGSTQTSSKETFTDTGEDGGSGDDTEDSYNYDREGEEGSGDDLRTDTPPDSGKTVTKSYSEVPDSGTSSDGDIAAGSSSSDDSSTYATESDFDFSEKTTPQINIEKFNGNGKKYGQFKIYQKETSVEFKIPSSGKNTKLISAFKRVMKKFFPKKAEPSRKLQ